MNAKQQRKAAPGEGTWSLSAVMAELKGLGTAQNRKVYRRHGAGEKQFGVSFANLDALRRRIKKDHELALELWQSGNTDARILATMIADPQSLSPDQAEAWLAECSYYVLVDALVKNVIFKTGYADDKLAAWTGSEGEWRGRAGWMLLSLTALQVASAVGTVEVDHGETSCRTPAAAAYIRKGWERKQQRGKAGSR